MTNNININIQKFVEKEIKHLWKKVSIILDKNHDALIEAKEQLTHRLDGMNEIREQLRTQKEEFVTKSELRLTDQKISGLQKLVYIGLGVWLVLSLLLVVILRLIP